LAQEKYAAYTFAIEHIRPRAKGGDNDIDNLALACQGCNSHKYDFLEGLDPLFKELAPLFNPKKDSWSDHFTFSEDAVHIIGMTPTGRATVDKLRLNREGLINLRKALWTLGKHPPPETA